MLIIENDENYLRKEEKIRNFITKWEEQYEYKLAKFLRKITRFQKKAKKYKFTLQVVAVTTKADDKFGVYCQNCDKTC
jgi:uncharacterized ferredoxin-like protein